MIDGIAWHGMAWQQSSSCSLLTVLYDKFHKFYYCRQPSIMKFSIPSLALISLVAKASAFSATPAFVPTTSSVAESSTSLFASRNKLKIASRSKWAESKGVTSADAEEGAAAGLMTNEHGLEYVKLANGDASADIYLFGGVVTSYIKDDVEYIAVRPDAKTDGSKPISGGLSHCWPQVSSV